jgi:hypothetical protein
MTYASVEIPARHIRGHTAGWLRWHNKSGSPLFPYFSWLDRWKEEAWLIRPKKKSKLGLQQKEHRTLQVPFGLARSGNLRRHKQISNVSQSQCFEGHVREGAHCVK